MNLILLLLFCLITQQQLFSQVTISYYPLQSILSISTNTNKLFFADFKLETNTFISNLNMEFSPKINFKSLDNVNYYTGIGISINPVNSYADLPITNGYFIDFGIRAKPFDKLRNLQLVFEISPYINKDCSGGNLRTRLGLSWNFTNESSKSSPPE
ncbi:MAG: hypothetical protein JST20_04375 [Bacteroidetes bacterium]|nr:hypothetical protein [Bacteroidota bacterium]